MHIEIELRKYLIAQSGISDIVGSKVHPEVLPTAGQYPQVTYHVISRKHLHNLDGGAGATIDRIQIDCWSYDYSVMLDLADAIRDKLDGFRGAMGDAYVLDVKLDQETDLHELPDDGTDNVLYHRACDYIVFSREAVPTL